MANGSTTMSVRAISPSISLTSAKRKRVRYATNTENIMIKMSKSRIVQEGSTLEEKILLKKQESFISTNLGIWKGKTNCFCGQGLLGVGARSVSFLGKVHFYGADIAQVIGAGEG